MSLDVDQRLSPYTAIGLDPRNEMGISGGLITMVEPDVGHERVHSPSRPGRAFEHRKHIYTARQSQGDRAVLERPSQSGYPFLHNRGF